MRNVQQILGWYFQHTSSKRNGIFTWIICCFVMSLCVPFRVQSWYPWFQHVRVRISPCLRSHLQRLFKESLGIWSSNHHPPKKALKQNFTGSKKKNCRLPIVFFETKKKPKKHRGKTKKQQQKTTTPGTSRGKKTQRVQRWENPMELRLTLGSFMGLSLGVTRLSLRGTLFLAFRHLTPHLPFLGIFGAILLFFFLLGKREKTWYLKKKSKQPVFDVDKQSKKGENFEMSTSWVDSCRCGWWVFTMVYCFGAIFFRQRESDVTLRSFLAVKKLFWTIKTESFAWNKHGSLATLKYPRSHVLRPSSGCTVMSTLWIFSCDIWWMYYRKRSPLLSFGSSRVNGSFPPLQKIDSAASKLLIGKSSFLASEEWIFQAALLD